MCRFKSGIILKNKVVLAPMYNDSHSSLLERLGIEDNYENSVRKFVRAELIPADNDMATDPKTWDYVVDQDVTPDWYNADPEKYENEFREAVEGWVTANIEIIAGKACTAIKKTEEYTYYMLADNLFKSEVFGKNNNYAESYIRTKLKESDYAKDLKKEFGDRLVPISTDLTSLDGLKDYGTVEGDLLTIPTIDLYREGREHIPNSSAFWLSTPDSTPSGCGSEGVRYVNSGGGVGCRWCNGSCGVRPVFKILNL